MLERSVLKLLQLGKANDLLVGVIHKFFGISQHRTAQIGILPDRHLAVKAAGKLQKRSNLPLARHRPLGRNHNARDRLEQSRFSRAVGTDDAKHIAAIDRKRNILICPELVDVIISRQLSDDKFLDTNLLEISRHVTNRYTVKRQDRRFALHCFFFHFFIPRQT